MGFSATRSEVYVSTSGHADVVNDQAKIDDLWSDFLKTWFPKGKDDPNSTLLKVSTHAGEYWDKPGEKMMSLFEMAEGVLTGEASKSGHNEKFDDEPQ